MQKHVYNDEETTRLIELWGEEDIQAKVEGCKRNKAVYEKIVREMVTSHFEKKCYALRGKKFKNCEESTRR